METSLIFDDFLGSDGIPPLDTKHLKAAQNFPTADIETEAEEEEAETGEPNLPITGADLYRNGIALFTGSKTVAKDQPGAVKLWNRAVKEFDHVESRVLLGMAHWNGEGCEQDTERAVEFLRTAGRAGERGAQGAYFLAMAYMEGNKVEHDPSRGQRWLRQAAKFKHKDAMYELGAFMIASTDPESLSRGCDWIAAAAEKGHVRAKQFMTSASRASQPAETAGAEASGGASAGISRDLTAGVGGSIRADLPPAAPVKGAETSKALKPPPVKCAEEDDWLTGVNLPSKSKAKGGVKGARKKKGPAKGGQ
mmetsp:Transcript_25680/g.57590  ORF Transcript_25680/g.57590 Transcript_25680/m.57590 type:complete len:308 (+) Transcript_25680:99-1022(+)